MRCASKMIEAFFLFFFFLFLCEKVSKENQTNKQYHFIFQNSDEIPSFSSSQNLIGEWTLCGAANPGPCFATFDVSPFLQPRNEIGHSHTLSSPMSLLLMRQTRKLGGFLVKTGGDEKVKKRGHMILGRSLSTSPKKDTTCHAFGNRGITSFDSQR